MIQALFPANLTHTAAEFHGLRGKGSFVVSAAWSNRSMALAGSVKLHSESGERCRLLLPPTQAGAVAVADTTAGGGKAVQATRAGQMVEWSTQAGHDYTLTGHN